MNKSEKCIEKYVVFNVSQKNEIKKFWYFVFENATSLSYRFPNPEHTASNTLKLKYNDRAEISHNFVSYLEKNKDLIHESNKYLIKKYISNIYLDDKYANLSAIYVCKVFDYIKAMVYKKPNIFEWLKPDLPEDLSFYRDNERFLFTCSHENLCVIYLKKDELEMLKKLSPSLI